MNLKQHQSLWGTLPVARYAAAVLSLLVAADSLRAAEDVVIVATGSDLAGRAKRSGEIVDYTGKGLVLRTVSGREVIIPREKVVRIETERSAPQRRGDEALSASKYADAFAHYRAAIQDGAESRGWMRREILASTILCKQALGEHDVAGHYFAGLVRDDPGTPHFDAIPLAWTSTQRCSPEVAANWLRDPQPAVALLGASYALATPLRQPALTILEKLSGDADVRITALATAQQWRVQVSTATPELVAGWPKVIARLPPELQAGPYHVLGLGLAARGQHERAAVAMMRIPILYPHRHRLAAESLLVAGKSLSATRDAEAAARVYRELVAAHPTSLAAAEAKQRLETLQRAP